MPRLENATKRVAEHGLAAERRHQLADHAHGRQHHDVHRRMRIEPEQVLEQHRIAAARRIEEAEVEHPLRGDEQRGYGDDRRAEDVDQACRVGRPQEQRHLEPRHAGRPHAVNRDDEVQARQDRREAGDENRQARPARRASSRTSCSTAHTSSSRYRAPPVTRTYTPMSPPTM